MVYVFFFFKQKTAYEMRISDWSSDVCSSDLLCRAAPLACEENRPRSQTQGGRAGSRPRGEEGACAPTPAQEGGCVPAAGIVRRIPGAGFRVFLAIILAGLPVAARADPCEAPLPRAGTMFSGVVRYIGDGDSLCVGPKGRPDRWIEVRLADFRAPELKERGGQRAKALLRSVAMGRTLVCKAGRRSSDRVVAACMLDGKPIGAELRRRGEIGRAHV